MSEKAIGDNIQSDSETSSAKETDLIDLFFKIWNKKRFIFKISFIAAVVAVIIAFSIPKEYETKVILAPEITKKNALGGNMGTLAAMAGINLGNMNSEDAIGPDLYPQIINSTPFLVDLFNVKVVSSDTTIQTTLYGYMEDHQKRAWWGYIMSFPFKVLKLFSKSNDKENNDEIDYFKLSRKQLDLTKTLKKRISANVDNKNGTIFLSVKMQDPLISAMLANVVKDNLQKYIVNYRTNKARQDLYFAEKLFEEAKDKYYVAQQSYATYTDGNLTVVKARYQAEADRLENEMELAYNVYNQVAQQLQLAKVKVQEITPIYTVIQPAIVSVNATSPNKPLILICMVFFAIILASGWILLKDVLEKSK